MLRLYSKQQRSAIAAISALEDANSERIRGQERQTPSGIRNTSVRERVRVLTEDEVEELVECYRSGDSTYVLSRRFGIGRETVSAHLRRNGVMRRANSRIDLDPEQRKRVIALYESRLSLKRVAEEVGVSERAVTRALDDAGIRRRAATEVLFGK